MARSGFHASRRLLWLQSFFAAIASAKLNSHHAEAAAAAGFKNFLVLNPKIQMF